MLGGHIYKVKNRAYVDLRVRRKMEGKNYLCAESYHRLLVVLKRKQNGGGQVGRYFGKLDQFMQIVVFTTR